jgi:hypothetical protein
VKSGGRPLGWTGHRSSSTRATSTRPRTTPTRACSRLAHAASRLLARLDVGSSEPRDRGAAARRPGPGAARGAGGSRRSDGDTGRSTRGRSIQACVTSHGFPSPPGRRKGMDRSLLRSDRLMVVGQGVEPPEGAHHPLSGLGAAWILPAAAGDRAPSSSDAPFRDCITTLSEGNPGAGWARAQTRTPQSPFAGNSALASPAPCPRKRGDLHAARIEPVSQP